MMEGIISKLENGLNLMEESFEQTNSDPNEELAKNDDNIEDESSNGDYSEIENVYFAFIDVLGFSKTFGAGVKDKDRKKELADGYKDIFNYFFSLIGSSRALRLTANTCAGQTSDSLYFYTDRTDMMIEFIKIYSHFSLYAMSKNIFFRGGIAKGCLFKNEPYQFFGDSIIKAYSLESQISKNPIITVDSSACEGLSEEKIFAKMKKEDEINKRNYIDPFYGWGSEIDIHLEEGFKCRTIDYYAIERIINDNLIRFEYDDNNYQKYLFLKKNMPK